ncbi:MAG: tRNA pseudouridine(55) synthase TruB [Oscillospiraceae bacterium]|nr:tRNA pseudouridine(55) synthase TruB [Oscillospiraceae bacterium]
MNGILAVNKPQEFTSFDVTAIVRKKFGTKKVGHGGTLDPMATGVLPVFIGNATKAVDLVSDKTKSYRAGFRLGLSSDTLDIWGELSEEQAVNIEQSAVEAVLENFRGEIEQVPPMYSALKINGQKLCDLARKGIEVERKARKITVTRLKLIGFDGKDGVIEIDCSAGTYIRSLIDDIGKALGTNAVMTSLVRTKSCGFTLSQCVSIDDIKNKPVEELLLWSVDTVFSGCFSVVLDKKQQRLYMNGIRLDAKRLCGPSGALTEFPMDKLLKIYGECGLLGVGKINEQGELISVKRFIND